MSSWQAQTRRDYQAKGFAARSGFGERPALLVVDFINAFTDPSTPLGADFAAELAVTARLLDGFRAGALPVFFTTTEYGPDFADAGHFIDKVPALGILARGSVLTAIDARIRPVPGERIVVKHYASAFFDTPLHGWLQAAGADTVVVVGCTTSGCVRASAVDALQNGYRTVVVSDAVADRAQGPHAASLFDIDAKYGDVVESGAVLHTIGALSGRAGAAAMPQSSGEYAAALAGPGVGLACEPEQRADADLLATLFGLEQQLVEPAVRHDAAALASLLADDCVEFGSSGRAYTRAQLIAALADERPEAIELREPQLRRLAPDTALLTYRSVHGGGARVCLRSSLWRLRDGRWQLVFHQGTPATA